MESLGEIDSVERVIKLDGVGHCPHDEAPELVNPLLLEFIERIKDIKQKDRIRKPDVPFFLR